MDNYDIENPELQATLRNIASKIGPQLPAGWGFMLMVFEYGGPGTANFYIASADRQDVIKVLREWIARNSVGLPKTGAETKDDMTNQWHKIVAILLAKYAEHGVTIQSDDLARIANRPDISVAVKESVDGLHLALIDGEAARRAVAQEHER